MKQNQMFVICIVFLLMTTIASAQNSPDKVVKRDGATIEAIITDISTTEIKYKKANYPTGPTYTLPISDVMKIILATGEEEVFNAVENKVASKPDQPKDTTPFSAEEFFVYSEDGQSILTDAFFPDNNRYLCIWNLDLELIKKINIAKYWSVYPQQITDNGSYLDKSIYYGSDGTELLRFKRKELGFYTEYSGLNHPGIVSPSGKRFLINEHGDTREHIFLFNEKGEFKVKQSAANIENFLFAHKRDMFYILRLTISGFLIETYDSEGKEIGTIKVKMIWNNVRSGDVKDNTVPQFSFDDNYIISRNTDTDVVVADIKGSIIRHLYQPMANAMTFSRDGKKIATAGQVYSGNSKKIEDETGNKIDYTGGSIKIWSFEGQLIKEINFPAKVQYLQFTPDNKGLAVLIGDIGSCVWLWEKDDYKLPDGFEKTVEEIAKYQATKRKDEIKDARLNFWVDMTTRAYKALVEGEAKAKASQARLAGEQRKAWAVVEAIEKRKSEASTNSPNTSGGNAPTSVKPTCRYHLEWRAFDKVLSISNIYSEPVTAFLPVSENEAATPANGFTVVSHFRSEDRQVVSEKRDDLIRKYIDQEDYELKNWPRPNQCSSSSNQNQPLAGENTTPAVSSAKPKCRYHLEWRVFNGVISISNIYSEPVTAFLPVEEAATPANGFTVVSHFRSEDRQAVSEKRDDLIRKYFYQEGLKMYDWQRPNQCK